MKEEAYPHEYQFLWKMVKTQNKHVVTLFSTKVGKTYTFVCKWQAHEKGSSEDIQIGFGSEKTTYFNEKLREYHETWKKEVRRKKMRING